MVSWIEFRAYLQQAVMDVTKGFILSSTLALEVIEGWHMPAD